MSLFKHVSVLASALLIPVQAQAASIEEQGKWAGQVVLPDKTSIKLNCGLSRQAKKAGL